MVSFYVLVPDFSVDLLIIKFADLTCVAMNLFSRFRKLKIAFDSVMILNPQFFFQS